MSPADSFVVAVELRAESMRTLVSAYHATTAVYHAADLRQMTALVVCQTGSSSPATVSSHVQLASMATWLCAANLVQPLAALAMSMVDCVHHANGPL